MNTIFIYHFPPLKILKCSLIDPTRTQLLNPDHVGAFGKAKVMTGITDFKFQTISYVRIDQWLTGKIEL